MRGGLERRGFLLGMGALALTPALAGARGVQARSVPEGTFVLQRVLSRGLADGKAIVVTRRWNIAFQAPPQGQRRITGTQTFAHVDAPPPLQAMAKMEASRDESSLFPIELDANGLIVTAEPAGPVAALPENVLAEALAYAKARSAGEDVTASSRQFFADLSQRGADWLTGIPRDLFYPVPHDRSAKREIALADGTTGTVEMREVAQADAISGLMTRFHREAVTTTETMSRTGSETWSLTPAVS